MRLIRLVGERDVHRLEGVDEHAGRRTKGSALASAGSGARCRATDRIDWTVFEKMISLYDSRSSVLYDLE